jgi:hypothetical protein
MDVLSVCVFIDEGGPMKDSAVRASNVGGCLRREAAVATCTRWFHRQGEHQCTTVDK